MAIYWEDITLYPTSDNKPNRVSGICDNYKIELNKHISGCWFMSSDLSAEYKFDTINLRCSDVKVAIDKSEFYLMIIADMNIACEMIDIYKEICKKGIEKVGESAMDKLAELYKESDKITFDISDDYKKKE